MPTYEEYYQYYKSLLDKKIRPVTIENSPVLRAYAEALLKLQNVTTERDEAALRLREDKSYIEFHNHLLKMREDILVGKYTPDNDDAFLHVLFNVAKIAALATTCVFAPEALAGVAGAIGSIGNIVATGVVVGAADAAAQGVGVAVGMESHISGNEILESAVGGAVASATVGVGVIKQAAAVSVADIASQLVEIKAGTRDKFDLEAVGLQAAATIVAAGIHKIMPELTKIFGQHEATNVAARAVNSSIIEVLNHVATGAPINVQGMLANVIGNYAGEKIGEEAKSKLKTEIKEKSEIKYNPDNISSINDDNYINNLKMTPIDPTYNDDVVQLMAKGKFEEAKNLAIQKAEAKHTPTNNTTTNATTANNAHGSSTVDILVKMAQKNGDEYSIFDNAPPLEKAVLCGLGAASAAALLPEAVIGGVGAAATALTIGWVPEVGTLEFLANPAFMQAAIKAGAIVSSSKLLNMFGVFERIGATERIATPANVVVKHPLEGWTVDAVISNTNKIGLKTPSDSLLLWSGLGEGNTGVKLSQEFANANGSMTLEMTLGGKWLDKMNLFGADSPFTKAEASYIWEQVSLRTIQQASGQVRAVVGRVSPNSIYMKEQSEMLMNKNISGLDELQLKPRMILK